MSPISSGHANFLLNLHHQLCIRFGDRVTNEINVFSHTTHRTTVQETHTDKKQREKKRLVVETQQKASLPDKPTLITEQKKTTKMKTITGRSAVLR